MKRRLLTLFSALSFMLLVSLGSVWAYATAIEPIMCRHKSTATTRGYELVFDRAGFGFSTENLDPMAYWSQSPRLGQRSEHDWVVLYYAHSHMQAVGNQPTLDYHAIFVRYWPVVLVSAILPGLWFRRYRRQRHLKQGHCSKCGYDLRASTDRCPECGTPIPAATASKGIELR